MKTYNSIEDFANVLNKGTFGMYVATLTDKRMNKYPCGCGRVAGTENPYEGRVKNLAVYMNAATGVNYYAIVKGECEREGIKFTDDEFAAAFPKEGTYCESADDNKLRNVIMENPANGQRYLRLYDGRKPTKVMYFTLVDDVICTDAKVLAEIARYTPAHSGSKKQEALGIANLVGVKQPKIENVLFMRQGDKMWCNEGCTEDYALALCKACKEHFAK